MSLAEFELIAAFFTPQQNPPDVVLGVGDDAAVMTVPAGQQLVVTTDSFVAGHHFFADAPPFAIGYKALAVNLSDLAAMGAVPRWVTLALTLPASDSAWSREFAAGFYALAAAHQVALVGGDTTRGPLSITIQAMGLVANGQYLTRSAARVGDHIYVSGYLGDAARGLQLPQDDLSPAAEYLRARLQQPRPRVQLGQKIVAMAHACLDISDGLSGDLGHILQASGVGACLFAEAIPLSPMLLSVTEAEAALQLALHGGDDYELCFTLPPEQAAHLAASDDPELRECHCIGVIEAEPGLRLRDRQGLTRALPSAAYDHFSPQHVSG